MALILGGKQSSIREGHRFLPGLDGIIFELFRENYFSLKEVSSRK